MSEGTSFEGHVLEKLGPGWKVGYNNFYDPTYGTYSIPRIKAVGPQWKGYADNFVMSYPDDYPPVLRPTIEEAKEDAYAAAEALDKW